MSHPTTLLTSGSESRTQIQEYRDSAVRSSRKSKPKAKPTNPIEEAINFWFNSLPSEVTDILSATLVDLIPTAPKRWVVYPPMVLLPSGSYEGEKWIDVLNTTGNLTLSLWARILAAIGAREGKGTLTHLAINNGIPLLKENAVDSKSEENLLRNPTGLRILYGDFGPSLSPYTVPSQKDFTEAFWVSTKQNGIIQIWSPRYTMFSRGNIKEKARILDFHKSNMDSRRKSKQSLSQETAIDLYAGIGYFVFSYVKMGIGKVVGFELNPWSIEGLRRGASANGWDICVVKREEEWVPGEETITVFELDNAMAVSRLEKSREEWVGEVTHLNCGLLPYSNESWKTALKLLSSDSGWLHLHENVGVEDIEARKLSIAATLRQMLNAEEAELVVEHVELVKTFAPGIWHSVFDIYVTRR